MKVKMTCESVIVLPNDLSVMPVRELPIGKMTIQTNGPETKHAELLDRLAEAIRDQAESIRKVMEDLESGGTGAFK